MRTAGNTVSETLPADGEHRKGWQAVTENAKRPVSLFGGCLRGGAAAACGITVWTVVFVALPDDDGFPVAYGIGVIVGMTVFAAFALRRTNRRAYIGMLVGVAAVIVATLVFKILFVDYP